MSSSAVIAAVTETLRNRLMGVQVDYPDATVTTRPPHKARTAQSLENQLNLFLYHLAPDMGWRQQGRESGTRKGHLHLPGQGGKTLALNLYYLVTAYGKDDDDIASHQLIGWVLSCFHNNPDLTWEDLRQGSYGNDLKPPADIVRLTPHPLSQEELSKVWAMYGPGVCGPTVAYQVSSVLIPSQSARPPMLPAIELSASPVGGQL